MSAPSYEGVGSLMALLSLAMGADTYARSDLARLLTFEGVEKALDMLYFPRSPTALYVEMKLLPALATMGSGAGLFAVLDHWTRLLLQELQLTPDWLPAPVVLAVETELEQRPAQRPRVGSQVESHDEDRARLVRLFRSPPTLSRRSVVPARRVVSTVRVGPRGWCRMSTASGRRALSTGRRLPERCRFRRRLGQYYDFSKGQVEPRVFASPLLAPASDRIVLTSQQFLQALKPTPKGTGPVGAYLRLMRTYTRGTGLESALADPNSGCTDPDALHPLLKEGFQVYHQIAFTSPFCVRGNPRVRQTGR